MTANEEQLFVALERDEHGYPPWDEEKVWAEPLDEQFFRLTVSPTFARGLSCEDVVHATPSEGKLYVDRVVRSGGHSTLRVVLFDDPAHDRLLELCARHGAAGLHTEIPGLFAVDVPPSATLWGLLAELREVAESGVWDVDEAALAHPMERGPSR